jgi:hypothetical protein
MSPKNWIAERRNIARWNNLSKSIRDMTDSLFALVYFKWVETLYEGDFGLLPVFTWAWGAFLCGVQRSTMRI